MLTSEELLNEALARFYQAAEAVSIFRIHGALTPAMVAKLDTIEHELDEFIEAFGGEG
jgi:hypothetical protein